MWAMGTVKWYIESIFFRDASLARNLQILDLIAPNPQLEPISNDALLVRQLLKLLY